MRKRYLIIGFIVIPNRYCGRHPGARGAFLRRQAGGGHRQNPGGEGAGMIHPAAPKGFMGIPGAPHHFCLFYILWGIWVGWIFSSVGAFGGIMAGVGHITRLRAVGLRQQF